VGGPRLAIVGPYLLVLGLFVLGVAAHRPDRRTLLLLGFLVLYNLLHVATHGFARYRLPIMPVLFLFAGHAFAGWRARQLPAFTPARRLVAAALLLAFAGVLFPSLRAPLGGSQDPPASEAR
jgi:hypothetical protein